MQELLEELDIIGRFDIEGKRPHYGEVSGKQRKIYESFGFTESNML